METIKCFLISLKQVFKAGTVLKRYSHAFGALISLWGGGTTLFLGGSGPQVNPNARTHSHEKREEQENGAVVLLDSPARNQTCSLIKLKASFIFSWRV